MESERSASDESKFYKGDEHAAGVLSNVLFLYYNYIMQRPPTIRDVARACGLSHMTVSNVMNNRPVSEATRRQVLEAMRELNYQPSAIARGLNRKPMDTLGVVLPHSNQSPLSHPYYGPVLDGIMAAAVSLHKDVTIYTGSLWTEDGEGLRRYRDGRTDGLLLVTPLAQPSLVRALLDVRVPFVCIGAYPIEPDVRCISTNDAKAGREVVEHLAGLGHSRIGYYSIAEDGAFKGPRRTGYERAMSDLGLELPQSAMWFGGTNRARVRQCAAELASAPKNERSTAIYCFNDEIALTLIEELAALGLRVPDDLSIVGFDDIPAAASAGLTTQRQPTRDIGSHAAKVLTAILAGQDEEPRTVLFDTTFMIRSTTAPPPPGS
jgi:DNA-binding LacI/PurR family transcriptional regulator